VPPDAAESGADLVGRGRGTEFLEDGQGLLPRDARPIPVDFDRIRDAAMQTGAIEILGPPPFEH